MGFDLNAHVDRHNRVQRALTVGYAAAAIAIWYAAYWIAYGFTWFVVYLWRFWFEGNDPAYWATLVAWGYVALLAFEGLRYGRRLFDMNSFAQSYYAQGFTGSDQERLMRSYFAAQGWADPSGTIWVIVQATLGAPRCTVNAWRTWKRIVRADPTTRMAAQQLFNELLAARKWVPLDQVRDRPGALWVLDRAGLLWSRIEAGQSQVRIAADLTHRLHDGR